MRVLYAIAKESYGEMKADEKDRVRPKPNGEKGNIVIFDPAQNGFKCALITIVFSCACLEALLHLLIGKYFGRKECALTDKCIHEDKMAILGCKDDALFDAVESLRRARKEILHEKAYCDNGKIKIAQKEAEKSVISLDAVCNFFNIKLI